jgi:hypothetical protein
VTTDRYLAAASSAVPIGPFLLLESALCSCEALCVCGWDDPEPWEDPDEGGRRAD